MRKTTSLSQELKYIYKASDCTDKNDCLIAIQQVKELQLRFGYAKSIIARMRSLQNKLNKLK